MAKLNELPKGLTPCTNHLVFDSGCKSRVFNPHGQGNKKKIVNKKDSFNIEKQWDDKSSRFVTVYWQ